MSITKCSVRDVTETIHVSVAGAEKSFSLLARVKDVLRSVMSQGRLSSLGVIAAPTDLARKIYFDHVI